MDINRDYLPKIPQIPNTHAVIERIAKNQVSAHSQSMESLEEIADLLRAQNELLRELVELQKGKA